MSSTKWLRARMRWARPRLIARHSSPVSTSDTRSSGTVSFIGVPIHPTALAACLESDSLLHEDRIAPTTRVDQALWPESAQLCDQRLGRWARRAIELVELVAERSARPVADLDCVCCNAHRGILAVKRPRYLRRLAQFSGAHMLVCRNAVEPHATLSFQDPEDPRLSVARSTPARLRRRSSLFQRHVRLSSGVEAFA